MTFILAYQFRPGLFFNTFPAFWPYGYAGTLSYFGFHWVIWSTSYSYLAEKCLSFLIWLKISCFLELFSCLFSKYMPILWVIFPKGLELFSNAWVIFPKKSLSYFWKVEKISLAQSIIHKNSWSPNFCALMRACALMRSALLRALTVSLID